ncbi:MAG: DUF2577 family protein [Candidatus Gastranaerophilales bacterium]|nr:DUF2577 family protein [Candidatus Gastranaerophilales bacterium]
MAEEQKNFFDTLADELKKRNNPTDLKSAILARVEEITPLIIVSYSDGKIMLTENDELFISEFFRLRCNIDKTGVLSSTVPSDTDNAESITETHSYTGTACNMPDAISSLASAILGVRDELLALKCDLAIGDYVLIASLEQKDRYILIDKVLNA